MKDTPRPMKKLVPHGNDRNAMTQRWLWELPPRIGSKKFQFHECHANQYALWLVAKGSTSLVPSEMHL